MENDSQILKSWEPPHNMYTFFLSNYEINFLTRSAIEMMPFSSRRQFRRAICIYS